MPAGQNIWVNITRDTFSGQDDIGGVLTTGTVVYNHAQARLDYFASKMYSTLAIGIESDRKVTFYIRPENTDLSRNAMYPQVDDIITIDFPPHHRDFGKKFRIMGLQYDGMHPSDPRGGIEAFAIRIEGDRLEKF